MFRAENISAATIALDNADGAASFALAAAEYLQIAYVPKPSTEGGIFRPYNDISNQLSGRKRHIINSVKQHLMHINFAESDSEVSRFELLINYFAEKQPELKTALERANELAFLISPFNAGRSEECLNLLIQKAKTHSIRHQEQSNHKPEDTELRTINKKSPF